MKSDSNPQNEHEQRLQQILAEYLELAEAGNAPDRDGFLARHSELADELAAFLDDRDSIEKFVAPIRDKKKTTVEIEPTIGTEEAAPPEAGDIVRYFGDYELLEEIARGGMGVVYKARQVSLNRIVALKMILAGQLASEQDVQRFHTEAEAAANLDHPNIVPIYEVGEHEGLHYFSMGFVDGHSLAERLVDGPLPAREAVELAKTLADAVAYAHEQGVIHRDLKPANVLIDSRGEPRITDFGLARRENDDSGMTATGQILGTPSYMPPEQAVGKNDEIGPQADVYALGATLYALLTGRPPFQGANIVETLKQLQEQEPVAPRQLNAAVPIDLETICLKCLEKDQKRRYESAAALSEELDRCLKGEPIKARPIGRGERTWRWCRRNPAVASLSALAALLLMAGAVVSAYFAAIATERADVAMSERDRANDEADRAMIQQQRADSEAALANEAKAKAETELNRSERLLYVSNLARARREWEVGNYYTANYLLTDTRKEFRGWEHDYLYARFNYGTRLRGHDGRINCVAISLDGNHVATGGEDHVVRVWNATTGREVARLAGHVGAVLGVAIHPSKPQIVATSLDDSLRLWDFETETELWRQEPGKLSRDVFFAAEGKLLYSRDSEAFRAFDTATGQSLSTFGKLNHSAAMSVSRDGRRIATVGYEIPTPIWDVASRTYVRSKVAPSEEIPITIWDAASARALLEIENPFVEGARVVALSTDAQRLAVACRTAIKVLDTKDGAMLHALKRTDADEIKHLAFGSNGRHLFVADDKHVFLWDLPAEPSSGKVADQDSLKEFTELERYRSSAPVGGLAIDAAGKRIAIGLKDVVGGTGDLVGVWDADNAQLLNECGGHSYPYIAAASFTPDGQEAITVGSGGRMRRWNADNGRINVAAPGFDSNYPAVDVSVDGKLVAACRFHENRGDGVEVRITDLKSNSKVDLTIKSVVNRLALRPGHAHLAVSEQEAIRIYDTATGSQVLELKGAFRSICFDAEGARLAASTPGGFQIWDMSDPTSEPPPIATEAGGNARFAWSHDKYLAVGGNRRTEVWDTTTQRLHYTIPVAVQALAFSPNGRWLALSADDKIEIWNAETGLHAFDLRGARPARILAFSPDSTRILSDDRIWSTLGDQEMRQFQFVIGRSEISGFSAAVINPQGTWFAATSNATVGRERKADIRLWNAIDGQEVLRFEMDHFVESLSGSADGRWLAGATEAGEVYLWSVQNGEQLLRLQGNDKKALSVTFSPDDKHIAMLDVVGLITLWDTQTGARVFSVKAIAEVHPDYHHRGHRKLVFRQDSRQLAVGHIDSITILDVSDGRELRKLRNPVGTLQAIDWSQDSRFIAVAGGSACVLDAETGQTVAYLNDPNTQERQICFSLDGRRVATNNFSDGVRIWDAFSGQPLFELPSSDKQNATLNLRFCADGKRLMAVGENKRLHIWDASRSMP